MDPLLSLDSVTIKYEYVEAITHLSLKIYPGEFVGIIGPNGGGKSTLVKTILGLIKPSEGHVNYHTSLKESMIGYVPQITDINKHFPITVKETVLMAKLPKKPRMFWKYTQEDHTQAERVLKEVNMLELKDRQINQLSGGEFKKVLIARALLSNPEILILDEPAAMVDKDSRRQIYQLLHEIKGKVTIVLVSHDIHDTKHLLTKLYNVNQSINEIELRKGRA